MSEEVSFGRWLRQRRRQQDLTQQGLATRIGYALPTIRRLEADDLRPSRELADRLADALALTHDERADFIRLARGGPDTAPPPVPVDPLPSPGLAVSATATRHNLPLQVASFVGRERELAEIEALLAHSRLVTLTGVGGTGKTRLAVEIATRRLDRYTEGIFLVDLSPLTDPTLVVTVIAQVLGVQEHSSQPLRDRLIDYLRPKRLLLLLDNFERVLPAAPLLSDLLAVAPDLTILVTSRVALRLRGEKEFFVPPLALPDTRLQGRKDTGTQGGWETGRPGKQGTGKETERAIEDVSYLTPLPTPLMDHTSHIIHSEAVRLFITRAQDVNPDFTLDETTAPVVAAICARLDGLPLAIELAAARCRVYTPQVMLQRLSGATGHRPLGFLTGGARDLPPRQQTLRDTITWSYTLLSPVEQRLFRRLGVFAGGFGLAAVEAVADRAEGLDVGDVVEALAAHSLLKPVAGITGEPRFTLLETLREFALEQLKVEDELEATRLRHAEYYLTVAEEGEWGLRGPQQRTWLQRLELEHDNIRAALSWSLAEREERVEDRGWKIEDTEVKMEDRGSKMENGAHPSPLTPHPSILGLRLAGAMWWFWWLRSHKAEAMGWLTQALAQPASQAHTVDRAKALYGMDRFSDRKDTPRPLHWLDESIALYREVDDPFGLAMALRARGQGLWFEGKADLGLPLLNEAAALFRKAGHPWGLGIVLEDEGNMALDKRDYALARACYKESAACFRAIGDHWVAATSLSHLAWVEHWTGNFAEARRLFEDRIAVIREIGTLFFLPNWLIFAGRAALEQGDLTGAKALYGESLTLAREWKDLGQIAQACYGLGLVNLRQDNPREAHQLLHKSLDVFWRAGRPRAVAFCLLGLSELAITDGRLDQAARLCGAARGLLQTHPPILLFELRYFYQPDIDALLAQFTDAPSLARLAEGEAMTLEQAVAYTLEEAAG